jgi:hypothetical protein
MNDKKAFFIGQSPLQVLNLAEASYNFKQTGLFYIVYDKEEIRIQISEIFETLEINSVIFQKRNFIFRIFFPLYMAALYAKILIQQGKPDSIFYGTYTTWASLIINMIRPRRTVLIDDGQKTVNVITNPHLVGLKEKYRPSPFSRQFVLQSTFFTYYDKIAQEHGLDYKRNRLENISTKYSKDERHVFSVSSNDLIFIGTNILSAYTGIRKIMRSIKQKANGRTIYYFSHRRDKKEALEFLTNELGIKVITNSLPIELIFSSIWRSNKPEVWAFSSTAVDTLLMLNDELRISVFRLSHEGFHSKNTADAFDSIHRQYLTEPRITLIDAHH